MGIVNVTPDSFSGDGIAGNVKKVVEQARQFAEDGADIIDIGGESTRPGSKPVPVEEELKRVIPVIEKIAAEIKVPLSIDTYKYEVASRALSSGANMINDIWGLKHDPRLADLAAEKGVPIVLMHNQEDTKYYELIPDIIESLKISMELTLDAGVPRENIIIDPGIGFGKTLQHNLEIMRHLDKFKELGHPVLLGTSRKSMIGLVLNLPPDQRLEGTAATVALGIAGGVDIVRVHDVGKMRRVCLMTDAIVRGFVN
ncbi:MAG: dihydropteroate synthase [Dehalococcoidia bacterium]|nr:dihydropteroate synthase [Dehalococcoidia bacterium]MDZ4246326.1 dihydropteroate synthase [Dehalococcoidia bacterium]